MTTASAALDRAAAPLDRARRMLLVRLVRLPALGPLVARRDGRLGLQAAAGVATAFALTVLYPGVLLVVGPALFGVAHVAADVRYLVLRRALPRAFVAAVGAACLALAAVRVLEAAFPGRWPFAATEVALGWAFAVGAAAGALAVEGTAGARRRFAVVGPLLVALGTVALLRPALARTVFAHLHNLIAVGLWLLLFRGRRRAVLPALALLAAGAIALGSGAALPFVRFDGPGAGRLVDEALGAWPAFVPQRTALCLGLLFVMLQAIHYAVWLAFIPQDDRRGEGTPSFRMSLRSLARDLPLPLLGVTAVAAVAVLGASFVDAHRTRQLYMSLAAFHGYLELAAAAFLIVRGGMRAKAR